MKLKDCYEELIDKLKSLRKYELGWSGYRERCGGPDSDGDYVELQEVIDLVLEMKDAPDDQ